VIFPLKARDDPCPVGGGTVKNLAAADSTCARRCTAATNADTYADTYAIVMLAPLQTTLQWYLVNPDEYIRDWPSHLMLSFR
jgi:hypothetical protein